MDAMGKDGRSVGFKGRLKGTLLTQPMGKLGIWVLNQK